MSFYGSLICDRCRVVLDGAFDSRNALPEGWLVLIDGHSCPGCSTREEVAERREIVRNLRRVFDQLTPQNRSA